MNSKIVPWVGLAFCIFFTAGHIFFIYILFERAKVAVRGTSTEFYELLILLQEKTITSALVVIFVWVCVFYGVFFAKKR